MAAFCAWLLQPNEVLIRLVFKHSTYEQFYMLACNRLHAMRRASMQSIARVAQEQPMTEPGPPSPGNLRNHGIIESVDGVTDVVLAAMAGAPNPRLRTVMAA